MHIHLHITDIFYLYSTLTFLKLLEERDYIEMGRLRDSLPSVKKSLIILHRNLTDTLTSEWLWHNG